MLQFDLLNMDYLLEIGIQSKSKIKIKKSHIFENTPWITRDCIPRRSVHIFCLFFNLMMHSINHCRNDLRDLQSITQQPAFLHACMPALMKTYYMKLISLLIYYAQVMRCWRGIWRQHFYIFNSCGWWAHHTCMWNDTWTHTYSIRIEQ